MKTPGSLGDYYGALKRWGIILAEEARLSEDLELGSEVVDACLDIVDVKQSQNCLQLSSPQLEITYHVGVNLLDK